MDGRSPGATVLNTPLNMLATLVAIGSLVACIVIYEVYFRSATPSAVIQDAFQRFEAPDR
jgi:enamine deaminase RidA (YjgF/YER057c/UK114 family)